MVEKKEPEREKPLLVVLAGRKTETDGGFSLEGIVPWAEPARYVD